MRFSEKLLSYFPTPYFLDMPHVGLDITPSSIKFIELVKAPGHLKIGKFGVQALSTPVVFDETLAGNQDLQAALTKIQRTQKISFVEVSIPEVKSYLYTVDVPEGDDAGIRANIEMHLEENVPLSIAEAVFEYFPIRTDKRNGIMTVAVSVVPYQIVKDYTLILEKSGMTPVSFFIEDQALSRAVIDYDDADTSLLVQISEKRTVLSIVADHAVQFTSSVPIGSSDFTDGLMREYGITKEEAEKMKIDPQYENVDLGQNKLFAGVINGLSAIKDETQRVFTYWQSFQDKLKSASGEVSMIKKIIISGRDGILPGLQEYFSSSLNAPVELANVWQNVFDLKTTVPDIKFNDALDFGTAIGLALPKHRY
ncbi:MAG: pilus assembly protein PilM [bacterium]